MQEFLAKMRGKRIELLCVGAMRLCGDVVSVEGGALQLRDDEGTSFVAIDKIVAVRDAQDKSEHRAGFISFSPQS